MQPPVPQSVTPADAGPFGAAVTLERRGYCLHAVVAPADYSAELVRRVFDAITADLRERPAWGILIDARALTGHISLAQRFFLGVYVSGLHLHTPIAVVAPTSLIDPGRFAILVARARGVVVESFTEREDAAAWLAGRTPVPREPLR